MYKVLGFAMLLLPNVVHAVVSPSGNGIVISDLSGSLQVNSPQSVTRFFKPREILHYAQAVVNGAPLLTQCDVKNRWQDGSVKFAIISFIVPRIDSKGTLVTFRDQATGKCGKPHPGRHAEWRLRL